MLLLLLLLAHCMLGLLVEGVGGGRLSWHGAGVQSHSLRRGKEKLWAAGEQPADVHHSAHMLASVASLLRMKSLDFSKLASKAVK